MRSAIQVLASLRLTVILLALSMLLVFIGTLVQARIGVWQVVDGYFRSPIAWVDPGLFSGDPGSSAFRIPLPGGATLGLLLLINLLAAHAVRFRATRRKIGILIIHAGLIVLLAGEFITGALAREGLMRIDEGGSASFLEDVRHVELAVVDPSDPETDRIIRIPARILRAAAASGATVSDPRLPFQVRVDQWLPSADLWRSNPARPVHNPATAGVGLEAFPQAAPATRGVDGAGADLPAAYVTLLRDGQALGTWLLWAGLDEPQAVTVGPITYSVWLRFTRTYLPFSLHLIDFQHDTFVGTQIPRNFSSDLRIEDPDRGVSRPARIWMNNPLRYRGMAFYQASYKPDGSGTVLQVVRNPGWLLPYIACAMVGLGLAWHFGASLSRFLKRTQQGPAGPRAAMPARAASATSPVPSHPPAPIGVRPPRWPTLVGIGLAALLAFAPLARQRSDPALAIFERLPVSSGGRIKPMDTAARNLLMVAGGRSSIRTSEGRIPASRFLLDLIALPAEATHDLPIVRVDDPDVLALLGRRPDEGGRLPLAAIEPKWPEIASQAAAAAQVDQREQDAFQRAILQLHSRVNTVLAHAQVREPYLVPPLRAGEPWRSFPEVLMDDAAVFQDSPGFQPHPAIAYYTAMMTAYGQGDAAGFERALRSYDELLARDLPEARQRARLEVLFNRAEPFLTCITLYTVAGLALLAAFLLGQIGGAGTARAAEACRRGASGMIWSAVVLHTVAILARMWLQERPPVTNLYSSAVFVGWAAALLGMLLERLLPNGLPALGSAAIGFCTLLVAHNLGNDGDTMQMMQAVLDSNFWLATHVVTITLGYSATFLAGTLGAVWVVRAALDRLRLGGPPTADGARSLIRAVYGVACFALLLSFIGTVLGGIWADQSWGRFWGWDPKENGAALMVLHLSLLLHARWGGVIRDRGIAVLAVAGNIVTAWSWFGTNMLGAGLHSYGFMDSAAAWLAVFVGLQVALMVLGVWAGRTAPQPAPTA